MKANQSREIHRETAEYCLYSGGISSSITHIWIYTLVCLIDSGSLLYFGSSVFSLVMFLFESMQAWTLNLVKNHECNTFMQSILIYYELCLFDSYT